MYVAATLVVAVVATVVGSVYPQGYSVYGIAPADRVPYTVTGGTSGIVGFPGGVPHTPDGEYCTKMQDECRIVTFRDENNKTHFEVSCYCYFEERDVSGALDDLSQRPCALVPSAGQTVDYAALNITRCYVERQPVPMIIMAALRRSLHLSMWFQNSRQVRLPFHQDNMMASSAPQTINMTIINSTLSGIGRGLVSGCQQLRVQADHSAIGVVGSGAFQHYQDDADVVIVLRDTNITKISKDAMNLPLNGVLTMKHVRLGAVDGGALTGSGEILLEDAVVGVMSRGAINMARLRRLRLSNCTLGVVEAHAFTSRGHTWVSHNDQRYRFQQTTTAASTEDVFSFCHVIVRNTRLMIVDNEAFVELCKVAQVTWRDNTVVDVHGGPLLLESPNCYLSPSSSLSATTIKCNNCSMFTHLTKEMCPIYRHAWCFECSSADCPTFLAQYISSECNGDPNGMNTLDKRNFDEICSGRKSPRMLGRIGSTASPNINCQQWMRPIIIILSLTITTMRRFCK